MKPVNRIKKPPVDPHSCRFLIQPRDGAAIVQIGNSIYLTREGYAGGGERYWTFLGKKGAQWTVHIRGAETIVCNCPDRLFRQRECKHSRAVRVLYRVAPATKGS